MLSAARAVIHTWGEEPAESVIYFSNAKFTPISFRFISFNFSFFFFFWCSTFLYPTGAGTPREGVGVAGDVVGVFFGVM